MGICCCKTQTQTQTQKQTANAIQNAKPESEPIVAIKIDKVGTKDINQEYETSAKPISDENDELPPMQQSQHWKTQTLQLLSQLSDDVMLGSDFEDDDDDNNNDEYDDETKQSEQELQTINVEPKQLVNIPRKQYLPKRRDTKFIGLEIGKTLKTATNSDDKCVWTSCNASNFKLRSIKYVKNKKNKLVSSKNALYDVIGMDCFQINDEDIVDNMDIDEMLQLFNIKIESMDTKYPNIIILSIMIPLFKKKERNGLHLLIYSKMSDEFMNDLNDGSVQLLDKLINLDEFTMDSVKMTLSIPNINETTLHSMTKKLVKTMNGKCMALRKHASFGYLNNNNDSNHCSKDIFLIKFNGFGLSKKMIKGLSTIRDHLKTIDFEIGFHIGTKEKETLPERLLLCTKIIKLNIKEFGKFNEFYTKTKDECNDNKPTGHSREETYVMDDTVD